MLRNLLGLNSTSREARLNATLYTSSENLRCKVGAGEVLDYSNSYLGDDKLAAIVEKARLANAPTRLDLRGNCFEAGAARALAMLIRSPYNVVAISLEWNNIGLLDQGVETLAGALEVDKPLLILDLRNNNIGPEGAKALAKALRVNRTLRQLDLRWNEVRNPGVFAFREALQNNHSLVTLELMGNNTSFDEIKVLLALMGNNTSFDEIGIEHLSRDHRPLQSMRRAKMMMRLDPTADAPALPPTINCCC